MSLGLTLSRGSSLPDPDTNIPVMVGLDLFNHLVHDSQWFDPILLTPECLDRLGKKSDDQSWEYVIPVGALKWNFRYNTEWYSEIGGIYIDSRVQYVHQVQNLYLDLTGKVLNIEL